MYVYITFSLVDFKEAVFGTEEPDLSSLVQQSDVVELLERILAFSDAELPAVKESVLGPTSLDEFSEYLGSFCGIGRQVYKLQQW